MAARKKRLELQSSLFGVPTNNAPETAALVERPVTKPKPEPPTDAPPAPKLRLVHSQPDEDVSIETTDDGRFWISQVRDNGGTRAAVLFTRKQLELLLRRIPAALAMGWER